MGRARPVATTLDLRQLVRPALLAAPLVVLGTTLFRGVDGGLSAGAGLALAVANLYGAARSLDWAAAVGLPAVAAVALGGYLARLAALTAVVLLLGTMARVDLPAVAVTLAVAHLGLLSVTARSIGAT
jgi:hypothetical protein